jgi:hypothetical protein
LEVLPHLEVSINQVVDLEILVVVTPRVQQGFSDLDPTKVTDEFENAEPREVDDWGVMGIDALVSILLISSCRSLLTKLNLVKLKLLTMTLKSKFIGQICMYILI